MNLSFEFDQNKKAYLIVNGQKKSVEADVILEVCQAVLANISPERDYKSITSLTKLMKIIDMELLDDDSDDDVPKEVKDGNAVDDAEAEEQKPEVKPEVKPGIKTVQSKP